MAEAAEKSRRRAFSREFKLSIVQWFHMNDKNVLQTSNHFKVDQKQVRNWVKMETRIRKQKAKNGNERGRNAFYPRMEKSFFRNSKIKESKGKQSKNGGSFRKLEKL